MNTMAHRILAVVFILACLTVQAQSAYACAEWSGAITTECCCPHDSGQVDCTSSDQCAWPQSFSQDPCCSRVIVHTSQFVSEYSGPGIHQKIFSPPVTPSLAAVIDWHYRELLLSAEQHVSTTAENFLVYYGLPAYLATNRLRI